jgi:sugar phosphate isomerase/epimerase
MRVTVVFGGFEGESYADIPTVVRTVGLVPPVTRAERLKEMLDIADFARLLGAEAVGLHVGALPEERGHADYQGVLAATQQLCDHCRRLGLRVHLETGQETAATLLGFLADAQRDNLCVNFDPANMILYESGDPIEALDHVGSYVRSVHCKDACRQRRAGQPWYEDAPLGQGDVGIERFLRRLYELGYEGPLTIEREYSPDQAGDLRAALELLVRLRRQILG